MLQTCAGESEGCNVLLLPEKGQRSPGAPNIWKLGAVKMDPTLLRTLTGDGGLLHSLCRAEGVPAPEEKLDLGNDGGCRPHNSPRDIRGNVAPDALRERGTCS